MSDKLILHIELLGYLPIITLWLFMQWLRGVL